MENGEKALQEKQSKFHLHTYYEVIGQVQAITRGEVDEAIASAKEAQKSWAEFLMNFKVYVMPYRK